LRILTYGLCTFLWLLTTPESDAQTLDPEIQQMTQELIAWTQQQFELYGAVDQQKLDSMNQRIRDRQAELDAEQKALIQRSDSVGEKLIRRVMMQSYVLEVPNGKIWRVKRVTCQTGIGDFAVLVTSVKFKEAYEYGEKITMPAFTPEASLLTSDLNAVSYHFEIIESEIK
jgi:hypothetical protein